MTYEQSIFNNERCCEAFSMLIYFTRSYGVSTILAHVCMGFIAELLAPDVVAELLALGDFAVAELW